MPKLTPSKIQKNLSEIQHLIGIAKGAFLDDKSPDRADKVLEALEKAFNLCVNSRK